MFRPIVEPPSFQFPSEISDEEILVLAIFLLAIGYLLIVGHSLTLERGQLIKQTEWPMYLGMNTVYLAVCVAALIKGIWGLERRIKELEPTLAENQSPAANEFVGTDEK